MNKRIKAAVITAISLLAAIVTASGVSASVTAEPSGGGCAASVFVAGDPDNYPIEYYDRDTGEYKGFVPDMLERISDLTDIDFTYISSGRENRQKSLVKNGQVEIVSGIVIGKSTFLNVGEIPFITAERDGETVSYGIGLTSIASEELKNKIEDALQAIPDNEKTGIIIDTAIEGRDMTRAQRILLISALVATVMISVFITAVAVIRKSRRTSELDALIDEDTGVGNGDYFNYVLGNLISEQSRGLYCLAYVGIDEKALEALSASLSLSDAARYAAVKLAGYTAATEYVAHFGNGVFAFLYQAENENTAERRISEAVEGVNKYAAQFAMSRVPLFRAGYCRLCEHSGADAEKLLYNAKLGYLYAEANDLYYHLGSDKQIAEVKKAQKLSSGLNAALENGEFRPYMQLIFDCKSGQFCGGEMLSRWHNRNYGLLHPHEYIPILNRTGMIAEHDLLIFKAACEKLASWSKPPLDRLFITCNFTRLSFSKEDYAKKISAIAAEYDFSHSRLVIEVTEDLLSADSATVSKNIEFVKDLGLKVAIDDMGAGFSSLADIYDNEIDTVKIEKDFLASFNTPRRRQMLRDIVSLVHNSGATVICEGIESAEQSSFLRDIGCDMMQGFYIARVLPISECEKLILARCDVTDSRITAPNNCAE